MMTAIMEAHHARLVYQYVDWALYHQEAQQTDLPNGYKSKTVLFGGVMHAICACHWAAPGCN